MELGDKMAVRSISEIIEEIRQFQIARQPLLVNNSPTSVLMMLNESVATQVRKLEIALENEIQNLNIYTAEGEALEGLVINWLPDGRLPGSHATGEVTFYTASPVTTGIDIPKGTSIAAVSKSGTLYFETTEDVTLNAGEIQVTAPARAVAAGSAYNVAPRAISYLPTPIPGITGVINYFSFTGGEDEETDDELRRRYIYAIKTAGKATAPLISQNVETMLGVLQTLCYVYAPGDLQVICDAPDGLSDILSQRLYENMAAGIVGCGCVSAKIINGEIQTNLASTWGGNLWVRPSSVTATEETITGTALDQYNNVVNWTVTIPAGTVPGDAVQATVDGDVYIKEVEEISYTGSKSYDFLIGLGYYPYLWIKPKEVGIDIQITIRKEATFERSLEWKIEQSVSNFIASLHIGQDLEFSDMVKAVFQNTLPPHQVFEGIDEIITCYAVSKGQTIGSFGAVLEIGPDERIILSSISVESI